MKSMDELVKGVRKASLGAEESQRIYCGRGMLNSSLTARIPEQNFPNI